MTDPEVPHADLIARLRGLADLLTGLGNRATLRKAADALAALGDTARHDAVVWDQGYQDGFERGVLVQANLAPDEGPHEPVPCRRDP